MMRILIRQQLHIIVEMFVVQVEVEEDDKEVVEQEVIVKLLVIAEQMVITLVREVM